MTEPRYKFIVRAAPYSDGSGYAAEAVIEPGDDGQPSVQINVTYKIDGFQWIELEGAINRALDHAKRATAERAA